MTPTFGACLRRERKRARINLRQLAAELGVSVQYLSDVELGRRPPLPLESMFYAMRVLRCESDAMIWAWALYRGNFELEVLFGKAHSALGVSLMRNWHLLTADDCKRIKEIVDARSK